MKNIIISVDGGLALNLRVASAQANISLSRFLADTLQQTLFPAPANPAVSRRIGVAKQEFVVPDSIDDVNLEIAALFNASTKPAP